jgi:hypothetical protein
MPLPMFEKKKASSVILERRGKRPMEVNMEIAAPGADMDPGLMEAAEDVLRAINEKSPMDLARALLAAFEICDSAPHEEGPHMEGENE